MFYEFALDPAALDTWDRVRFFLGAFGPWTGRFIAKYPRSWPDLVLRAVSCRDVERLKIVERLNDARLYTPRSGSPYVPAKSWLDNARAEHALRPFRSIIASGPTASGVISADEIDWTTKVWNQGSGAMVPRTAREYAAALEILLRMAKRLVIVDPNFRPWRDDHKEVLKTFGAFVGEACMVSIHVRPDKDYDEHFALDVVNGFGPCLPRGTNLTVYTWSKRTGGERIHNRYVFTDLGGVQFGDGVEQGGKGQNDRVAILDESSWNELWAQYVDPADAFNPVGEPITTSGTGTSGARSR